MKTTALFFKTSKNTSKDLKHLMECCRNEKFHIEDGGKVPAHEKFKKLLPSGPAVIFLPALEKDCIGVKLTRNAHLDKTARVIILYADTLPSKKYLCLAFREGVDDVITFDSDDEMLSVQLKRAEKLLSSRCDSSHSGDEMHRKIDSLHDHCQHLEQTNAKWEERLLALASSAIRMATGELQLAESAPSLLIAVTSSSQASSVTELSRKLGFDLQVVHSGKDALKKINSRPPRVILTDGTLPDMDAKTLAQSARKNLGKNPSTIIAWSSNPQAEEKLLAPETGIDDFVLKSAGSEATDLLAAALLGGLR